ncbi:hypothetical protein BaRGS_00038620 [Batillaria attramentaria]|uniref:Uncharacterized protein n=1 Tax=Batillaria attramentaria TaxID=370345 RepID=A0ABD0J547_9CAEN
MVLHKRQCHQYVCQQAAFTQITEYTSSTHLGSVAVDVTDRIQLRCGGIPTGNFLFFQFDVQHGFCVMLSCLSAVPQKSKLKSPCLSLSLNLKQDLMSPSATADRLFLIDR